MFTTGLTQAQVLASVQGKLKNLRDALTGVQELYGWTSGLALADLETAFGFSASDAQAILSAVADANGLANIYATGTDSRNPGAGYIYAASQRQVIGPQ